MNTTKTLVKALIVAAAVALELMIFNLNSNMPVLSEFSLDRCIAAMDEKTSYEESILNLYSWIGKVINKYERNKDVEKANSTLCNFQNSTNYLSTM